MHKWQSNTFQSFFNIKVTFNRYQMLKIISFLNYLSQNSDTAQKMKFSIKDFFSRCDQIRGFLRYLSNR